MLPEVEAVLSFVRGPRGALPNPMQETVFQRVQAALVSAPASEKTAAVVDLAAGLRVPDALQAACVALTCGTLVERGASADAAGGAIVARLHEAARRDPGERQALQWLCLASMACLARSATVRAEAQRMEGLAAALEPLEESVRETSFVQRVLELVDDVELLVLAPHVRRGYRVRLQAIRTNFHLFTLLQAALIGDPGEGWLAGEAVDPEVVARARGQWGAEPLHDHARFHFHDWTGLDAAGALRPGLGSTLWGEANPRSIPEVDGTRVVLLGPMVLAGRSWNAGFFAAFHDALRSAVEVVARLEEGEVERAAARIGGRSGQ